MHEIGVGILGLGNIGSGVVRALLQNGDLIADRTGIRLVVRRIAERDEGRAGAVGVDPSLVSADAFAVVEDPSVDVVVELIGGTTVARELTLKALGANKPVVTANKALLAEHGAEVFGESERTDTDLYFEASVAGGIPLVQALREGLVANHVHSIFGILNGTCNYILTRMKKEGLPMEAVLREAQAAGFAEAEPSLDIDGLDAAHKAVILASLAYGFHAQMDDVSVRGIRDIEAVDVQFAEELGYVLKLLAVIRHVPGGMTLRVEPMLLPEESMLASVNGVFNAVLVDGDMVGDSLYYGRGAGPEPTASAVISDLVAVARNLVAGSAGRVPALTRHEKYEGVRRTGDLPARYYLRFTLEDRPGMLGRLATELGDHDISIASMKQLDSEVGGAAAVIILTHESAEENYDRALAAVDSMDGVLAPTVRYRIEEFDRR